MDGTYAGVKAVKIGERQREKRCGSEKEMLASDWLTKVSLADESTMSAF